MPFPHHAVLCWLKTIRDNDGRLLIRQFNENFRRRIGRITLEYLLHNKWIESDVVNPYNRFGLDRGFLNSFEGDCPQSVKFSCLQRIGQCGRLERR
ncbi:MAG: hypothetical protein Q7U76_14805 [Nitrospirota bacterium]|nr:hypothetical protein [Nitrospirota bacterium]